MYGSPVRMPMMGPPLGHGPLSPHEGPLEHPHHHAAMLKQHPGAYMAAPGSPMLFMPTPPPHGGGQVGESVWGEWVRVCGGNGYAHILCANGKN